MSYETLDEQSEISSGVDVGQTGNDVNRLKALTAFACLFGSFVRGIAFTSIGPALPDFLQVTNTPVDQSAILLVPRAASLFLGILSARYLMTLMDKVLLATASLPILAVTTALIPSSSSVWFMAGMIFLAGLSAGVLSAVLTVILVDVGGEKYRDQLVQAEYTFKSLGLILGPIVVRPFLSKRIVNLSTTNLTSVIDECQENCSLLNSDRWTDSHVSSGYVVLGAPCSLPTILFLGIIVWKRLKGDENGDVFHDVKETKKLRETFSNRRVVVMTILLSLLIYGYSSGQCSFQDLFTTFCIKSSSPVSKAEAALMIASYEGAVFVARLNAIWVVKLLTPLQMVVIDLFALTAIYLSLCIWAEKSKILLWVATILLGCFYSSLLPSLLSCSMKYISADPVMVVICLSAQSFSALILPSVIPLMFVGSIGPMALMYFNCGSIMLSLILGCPLNFLIKKAPHSEEKETCEKDHELTRILENEDK